MYSFPIFSGEYQSSIDNAYEEIASEEEALKRQEAEYGRNDKEAEALTGSPTIPPAVRETYPAPEPQQPESVEPQPVVVQPETNEEYVQTTKEPERPATLIESYQGYYREPTVAPVPPGPAQPLVSFLS